MVTLSTTMSSELRSTRFHIGELVKVTPKTVAPVTSLSSISHGRGIPLASFTLGKSSSKSLVFPERTSLRMRSASSHHSSSPLPSMMPEPMIPTSVAPLARMKASLSCVGEPI